MKLQGVKKMIFSELYSVYYNTVAKIIEKAFDSKTVEKDLQQCVVEEAFSESILTILPALKSGKWPLLKEDLSPVLSHKPTMPLTYLEKRWLKAISEDPRVRLFGVEFPELDDVEPLFKKADYCLFDQYNDGDPFEDGKYIQHFQLLLKAMHNHLPVKITMMGKNDKIISFQFYPKEFEYSVKDDKIRVITSGCKYKYFNIAKMLSCEYYTGSQLIDDQEQEECIKELVLLIKDERNALERVMLHFSHFEKQAERIENNQYILRLKYYRSDEIEVLIRVLSFGPYIRVLEPKSFIDLIKERLFLQKSCGLE